MTINIPNLQLLEKIGDGGTSCVWKANDLVHRRLVAVKALKQEVANDVKEIAQFRTEERFLEEIRHPGIVRAYDFNQANGIWYYVMEFVDGYSFADLLRRKQHVRESDCLLICESIAAALDYAWNDHGIVHCDIKPENIMINTDGVIKLLDLGISHRFEYREGLQDVPEHVYGTPAYISPEQVYGDVELDCRADIYALGATLYHLATGRILYPHLDNEAMMRAQCDESLQAVDPRTYRPELTDSFCRLLESMLVKDRNNRLGDWKDIYAMCQDVENGIRFKPRDVNGANSSIKLTF